MEGRGNKRRAEETRGGWALPPKVEHPPAEIPGCAPEEDQNPDTCMVDKKFT